MLCNKLKFKIEMWYIHTISIKKHEKKNSEIDGVVMGVYNVWGSFLLKSGGEFLLDEVFSV